MELATLIGSFMAESPLAFVMMSIPAKDASARIMAVNDAFIQLTGFAKEDLIGADMSILHGDRTNRAALQRMSKSVATGQAARVTVVNYRKSGERYLCDIETHPLIINKKIVASVAFKRQVAATRGRISAQINRPSALQELMPQLSSIHDAVAI